MSTDTSTTPKQHVSVVIAGHVDSGKSSLCGRLLFELGGISDREMQKLRDEAKALGKDSFCYAFYMDRLKDERERGITIVCTTKEFFTPNYHYTIIDAPGHRDFIKNMISGASQADVAVIMVPADGNFPVSIAKGDHKSGETKGQSREHARLINLLGVKQLIICVNKMDDQIVKYSEERYKEIRDEVVNMLVKVGWNKTQVAESVPIIPISGWEGDNLLKTSEKMPWWKGVDVKANDGSTVHLETLHDALDKFVKIPKRPLDAPLRMPVSGLHKIKGVGDVITGRIEQGTVNPGDEIAFIPTNFTTACAGKVFSIEMHHKSVPFAGPGDNVGLNVKGLDKSAMPTVGDIIVLKSDKTAMKVTRFTAQVQVLDHPGELKVGYTPVGHIRTCRAPIKISKINWKMGKETGNQKVPDPVSIKMNDMAEVEFEPQQDFFVEPFNKCEGLARLAILDGGAAVMLGKVVSVTN